MIESFINQYDYYKKVNLKKYNTYHLESYADYLIYPRNITELITLIQNLKATKTNYTILGGGSNIILAKPNFDVIIKLDKLNTIKIKDNIVVAEAGVSLIKLANQCMEKGLYGLAFAGGIPGTVGASTAMNAGAYNEDMSMTIKEVKVLTPTLEIKTMTNKELQYTYRDSFLKQNKNYIVVETTFQLTPKDKEEIKKTMEDRRMRRVATQPLDKPSAGSVFRNPPGQSAGKLIEDLGLKGYSHKGAMISDKHANFIINTGTATYEDILFLINHIKQKVKEEYNIDLILEQEIIR